MSTRRAIRVLCAVAGLTSFVWLAGCVNAQHPAPPGAGPTASFGNASPTTLAGGPHNQTDVHFLEQAVPLRRQAVMLADLGTAHSAMVSLRSLAAQIAADEEPTLSHALDWLRQWGQPAPGSATPSPDPVTADQLRRLKVAHGAKFDRQWADDIERTLTRSLALTGTEHAAGEFPSAKAMAVQWSTELRTELRKLSEAIGS